MGSPKEVNINAGPNGVARVILEKGQIQLKDLTTQTFETDDLEAFATFAKAEQVGGGKLAIFYDHNGLVLAPTEGLTGKTKFLATCTLRTSDPLALLQNKLGREMSIIEFEKLLTALRRHGSFMTTISQLRSLVVSKETKYERQVDNQANFKLLIERKGGVGDWAPPATLTFSLPVFAFLEDLVTVETDLIFSMKDEDGGAPVFVLENLTFREDLKARQREILETRLGALTSLPTYWGKTSIHPETDSYLYRENGTTL